MKNILLVAVLAVFSAISAKSQDSSDAAITKRLGVTCFPLEQKVGLTYCFGRKGRMRIEDNIKLPFSGAYGANLGQFNEINEFKFMYAWKSCGHRKWYSGVELEYGTAYFNPGQRNYAVYGSVIPLGVEWFPFNRLSGLSMIVESSLTYQKKLSFAGHVGLCWYF